MDVFSYIFDLTDSLLLPFVGFGAPYLRKSVMKADKKLAFFSCVALCQQSNGYPILKYFDSIRQP